VGERYDRSGTVRNGLPCAGGGGGGSLEGPASYLRGLPGPLKRLSTS
jgi:hypothetical protein